MVKKQVIKKKSSWLIVILIVLVLSFFSFLVAGLFSLFLVEPIETGNVALINVKGVITVDSDDSYFAAGGASSSKIVEQIENARDNDAIEAVIVNINSPGGSAVASSEIANAIKELDEYNKTSVALIRELGASGGYWIASSADHVIAHDLSITGSIGVISSYLDFSRLLENYNVSYQRLVAGDKKDMGVPFRELTDEEEELFQVKLDYIHEAFIQEVVENRDLSYDHVKSIADGSFLLGGEAFELGLVDQLGSKNDAIEYLEQELNTTVEIVEYKDAQGLLDILTGIISEQFFNIGQGMGSMIVKEQNTGITV